MNITVTDVLNVEIRRPVAWPPLIGEESGAQRVICHAACAKRRQRAPWRKARHLARRGNRR
jgi:hypothetical protein